LKPAEFETRARLAINAVFLNVTGSEPFQPNIKERLIIETPGSGFLAE
jgi:hypothetical protein